MNGVHAAFEGSIGKDAEVRSTRDGKPWASSSVAVDGEAPTTWCGGAVRRCRGRRSPEAHQGQSGLLRGALDPRDLDRPRRRGQGALNLAAWEVQPMGQIGRRKQGPSAR